jgi:hypothetical protein
LLPLKKKIPLPPIHASFLVSLYVRYKGNPCSKFVLKGGLDDTFLKGGLKGGPDIILGFNNIYSIPPFVKKKNG